ncbi:EBSC protein [Bacillus thuringiensis serovar andalousiensis]|uniref:EBSC protein n=1 Tax=Bacillus thuringiensis TaxID=1428 RepID=A0A9X6K8U2_BACTU|nr:MULTISPECIES: YbaK/EbsC family protein [Bacillus cereus group]MDA2615562.1 YbaK/EbsC family protein [Bacillus cereus]MEB8554928.1 YbaK/EbsC family protein [Bacillus cereus]MEB8725576.1 YbaK/EbsC family protein [Bacillus cereus]MEB8821906.1 YbaK/EbsC family protein [Bacillus cereus]MEB8971397.1 YbaK/EbsC family protein [Bacillus cereus]
MALEKVISYFKQYGMEDRIIEVTESSATVELAAKALQCEPQRIAKTLSFQIDDRVLVIVTAGDVKIDNRKYKEQFGVKAKMVNANQVEGLIGHAIGGVCPFAVNKDVEVYLDISLQRFITVFPACGSTNSAIELTIKELEKHSKYLNWIDVCKGYAN